jgi:anthranilate/para-aminobenzoate synthase component I
VIALPAAALEPSVAARRAAARPGACWLVAPSADQIGIARDLVGAAPVEVVRGRSVADLERLEATWATARAAWSRDGLPPAGVPAAAGWFSYELGRRLMGLPPRPDGADAPLFELHFYDAIWNRPVGGQAVIWACDEAAARRLAATLGGPPAGPSATPLPLLGRLEPVHPPAVFLDGVRRILDYLQAGDAYQVNLSRRLRARFEAGDPLALAAALRARAPAPHAAFLADADGRGALIGNSPERFLSLDPDGVIETRPIKGTRPRGGSPAADRAAVAELLASPKDRAEHVMIVDLERNDLGRICRTSSVEVVSLAQAVALPTVHHLVSTVRGVLRPDVGLAALLRATFPGGSITGAPKRRAMQIIDELEPSARGAYTGATGWLGAAGDLDLAIAIRTAVVRDGALALSVGAGIVADSTPEGELAETEVKARAFEILCAGADRG